MAGSQVLGVRELKAHASEVLREVESNGTEFVITVRGRPVARIEPLNRESGDAVDGMGNTRDALNDLPDLQWEDFVALKRIWEPRDLDTE